MTQVFIPILVSNDKSSGCMCMPNCGPFLQSNYPQYPNPNKRRWKNDSTIPSAGRDQKMWTLAECGHFIQWSASWQTASCHQISGPNVISPILPSWPNPIKENVKVPWNAQKWPSMAIWSSHLLHGTMHDPTKFQANNSNTLRVRAVTFSFGPVPSLFWKFQSAMERTKMVEHGHFI